MTIRSLLAAVPFVLMSGRRPLLSVSYDAASAEIMDLSSGIKTAKIKALYWSLALADVAKTRKRLLPLGFREMERYIAIRRDGTFDAAWYVSQYQDVERAGYDPLHHLVHHGLTEGRFQNQKEMLAHLDAVPPPPVKPAETYDLPPPPPPQRIPERTPERIERPTVEAIERGCLHRFSDHSVRVGLKRFARFPLFKETDYFALNLPLKTCANLVAHQHAFTYGFSEGRRIFDRLTVANELGRRSRASLPARPAALAGAALEPLSISILCNGSGNSFLSDIASCLLQDLRADGHDVVMLDDRSPRSALRQHNIVVAPHEFFFVGNGSAWADDAVVSRSVMLNTEQPQTIWFDRAVPFNLMSKGVIDISPQVAAIYGDAMPAMLCDLTGAPPVDVLPDASDPFLRTLPRAARLAGSHLTPFAERPVDVSFFGGVSSHRERFFARTAGFFADYKTVLYCRRDDRPLTSRPRCDMLGAARHVAFHSKIALNIHREEFGFFEWHRIVRLGMAAGAVVVSEPCLPHPDFKPGVHYFEESGRHIQNLVEWLIRSPEGIAKADRVRGNALALLEKRRQTKINERSIAAFLREVDPS